MLRVGSLWSSLEELDGSNRLSWRDPTSGPPSNFKEELEDWQLMLKESSNQLDLLPALAKRFPQLCFPIQKRISKSSAYLAAVKEGKFNAQPHPSLFSSPNSITFRLRKTPLIPSPEIIFKNREDFENAVRALAYRNEPIPIPKGMGALLVGGLMDWESTARRRKQVVESKGELAWRFEEQRLSPGVLRKSIALIGPGPYSGVWPAKFGPEGRWLSLSLEIRGEHEAIHYLTKRYFGRLRQDMLEELLADWSAQLRVLGQFDPDLQLELLGLKKNGTPTEGARIYVYRRKANEEQFATVCKWVVEACKRLEAEARHLSPADAPHQALLLMKEKMHEFV